MAIRAARSQAVRSRPGTPRRRPGSRSSGASTGRCRPGRPPATVVPTRMMFPSEIAGEPRSPAGGRGAGGRDLLERLGEQGLKAGGIGSIRPRKAIAGRAFQVARGPRTPGRSASTADRQGRRLRASARRGRRTPRRPPRTPTKTAQPGGPGGDGPGDLGPAPPGDGQGDRDHEEAVVVVGVAPPAGGQLDEIRGVRPRQRRRQSERDSPVGGGGRVGRGSSVFGHRRPRPGSAGNASGNTL